MRLTSNDLLACKDYCISDAGANCLLCERLYKTQFIQMLIDGKLALINKEANEIKQAEDLILSSKLSICNTEIYKDVLDYVSTNINKAKIKVDSGFCNAMLESYKYETIEMKNMHIIYDGGHIQYIKTKNGLFEKWKLEHLPDKILNDMDIVVRKFFNIQKEN